jgi:pantothenate synthetase
VAKLLVRPQDKLRRELNKARFQVVSLRKEVEERDRVIAGSKDAEQMRAVTEEKEHLKLQVSLAGAVFVQRRSQKGLTFSHKSISSHLSPSWRPSKRRSGI